MSSFTKTFNTRYYCFETSTLNSPTKEKNPQKNRVKVDLKACAISHKNVVNELEEKERKDIKIDHPKGNQNINMIRNILTEKNLKTPNYLLIKVMKNSAVKKMNYMRRRMKKFLHVQNQLNLVSNTLRKCGSH